MDLLRLVSDERCVACDAPGALLCRPCRATLRWLRGPRCARCGGPARDGPCATCRALPAGLAQVRSAVRLEGAAASAVRAWKDHGRAPVARLAERCLVAAVERPAADALVPVPAAPERAAWRGVDGPAALAALLGRRWRLPVCRDLLERRDERPQRGLDAAARRARAQRAFRGRGAAPARCLLVDDVMTTGATLGACAEALVSAGAERVGAVTFARVVIESQRAGLPPVGSEE